MALTDYSFSNRLSGQWTAVSSSCVAAIRWEGNVLSVQMKDGRILPYAAPESEFRRMLEAKSKGKHLNYVLKSIYEFLG